MAILSALMILFSTTVFATAEDNSAADETITRVQEITSLRETNSETFLLSDGTYECVVYAYDKYYADENDALHPIDNTIAKIANTSKLGSRFSTTGTVYKNSANAFDVYFSEGNNPEVSIQYKDTSLTFSPLNDTNELSNFISTEDCAFRIGEVDNCATLGALTATGNNTVTYSDVFADTDLVYVLENNALKEYIVLNSSNSSNAFSFVFTLDGLTVHNVNGSMYFTAEDGTTALSLGGLFAIDANGVLTEALNYSFTPADKTNKVIVTITLDENYLSSADRAFPVVIDPTIMISSSETADACVCSGYPNTNYKTAFQLRTGYDTDFGIRRSYIKFDIPSSIPMHSVTTATLDIEKVSGVAPTMRAYRCAGYWSSGSITWSNKPDYSTADQSTVSELYRTGSTWYTMNVTGIVQSWVDYSYSNFGFVLRDLTESDPEHWTTLYSSYAASPHKPELHITYNSNITEINSSAIYTQYINAGYNYQFSFTPTESGTYVFESSGAIDTYATLFQSSTLLVSDDDTGKNSNFKINYRLISGVNYILLVRGYSTSTVGTFSVSVREGWPVANKPTILSRSQWGATAPIESRLVSRTRNPERIIFHHSAEKFSSTDIDSTKEEIKRIQELHMDSNGKCDIAYHFIIDPQGRIWTGAEIDDYQRGHATEYFDDIGVLILGDFEARAANFWSPNVLNQNQMNAMIILSKWLCYEYDLLINTTGQNVAPVSTHRVVDTGTVCPGSNAAPWIEDDLRSLIYEWRS